MNKKALPNAHVSWAIVFGHAILLGVVICLADFAVGDVLGGRSGLALTVAGCLGVTVVLVDLAGPAPLRVWKRFVVGLRTAQSPSAGNVGVLPPAETGEGATRQLDDLNLKARAASDRLRALARACAEVPVHTDVPVNGCRGSDGSVGA